MRSAARVTSTPGQWHDAQQREREKLARQLAGELAEAYDDEQPWYLWVLWRARGEHHHELRDTDGRPIACPARGCEAVSGRRQRKIRREEPRPLPPEAEPLQLAIGLHPPETMHSGP